MTGDVAMAIGNAVERDQFVYVYDEKGYQLGTLFAGNGPDDGLKGYTSTTVNVRLGAVIYTYNAEGRQLSSTLAR
jgi:hypothetical protein